MAEKKYIDFPAGTYDTAKIFLQADASTGELEKVNLPAIAAPLLMMLRLFFYASSDADYEVVYNNTGADIDYVETDGSGQYYVYFIPNLPSAGKVLKLSIMPEIAPAGSIQVVEAYPSYFYLETFQYGASVGSQFDAQLLLSIEIINP